jgi:hypothetical protein
MANPTSSAWLIRPVDRELDGEQVLSKDSQRPSGDTRKYTGLGGSSIAKAILAEESSVKSTVFLVDQSDDGGPY